MSIRPIDEFPEELRRARRDAGLTSDEAARRIGISMPNYSAWENGRRTPSTERQRKALELLKATPAPAELAAVLHDFQREVAALAARYFARLLRTADESAYLHIADAIGRMTAPPATTPVGASGEPSATPPRAATRRRRAPHDTSAVERED